MFMHQALLEIVRWHLNRTEGKDQETLVDLNSEEIKTLISEAKEILKEHKCEV